MADTDRSQHLGDGQRQRHLHLESKQQRKFGKLLSMGHLN